MGYECPWVWFNVACYPLGSWCRSRLLRPYLRFSSIPLQVRACFSKPISFRLIESQRWNQIWKKSERNLKEIWKKSERNLKEIWKKSERNLKEIWKKSERNLKEIWSQKMISQSHEDTCRCPADPSRNLRGKMECGWMRGLLVDSGHIL